MIYISPSKLKRFRSCPFQCKNEPFVENVPVKFGRALHEGLKNFLLTGEDPLKVYQGKAGQLALPMDKEPEAKEALDFALDFISKEIPRDNIIEIESLNQAAEYYGNKYFEVPITNDWGFRGAMDVVSVSDKGELEIIDWKSGNSKEEDDLQLAIYALSSWKLYPGFETIKTKFVYIQQNFVDGRTWDSAGLANALNYVLPLVKEYLQALKSNNWKQTPYKYCNYCNLKEGCEAFQKQLIAKPDRASYDLPATIENLETILEYKKKVGSIAKAAYSVEKLLEEKLREIIGDQTLTVNGRDYKYKEKVSRYNYDLPAIFKGVQEIIKRPPIELCEYSGSGLKELNKSLDKDQKKAVKKIVESSREVKTKNLTLKIEVSKEQEAA